MPPRRPLPLVALVLTAAAALSLPACSPQDAASNGPPHLSDLGSKADRKSDSMLKLGDAARQAGDCETAIRFYRQVKGSGGHAGTAAARIGTADCELAMGALAEAASDYQAAAGLSPRDPTPLIGLGRVALVDHRPAEAAANFDRAVEQGADAAFVWNDRGVADDQLRRHKDAQAAYRQGLAKYPDDRALRNNLALSLAMTGDFSAAETLLRPLVAEPGATARTRQNLALVLGLEGNIAGARQIAQGDLDGAALDNNSRFYQYARALIAGTPLPSPTAALESDAPDKPVATANAQDAPVPPPVLVADRPLHGLRTAEPPSFEDDAPMVAKADPDPAATQEVTAPPPSQTAALPPATDAAAAQPEAAPAPAGPPTRIVGANGGPLENEPADGPPVASSENR